MNECSEILERITETERYINLLKRDPVRNRELILEKEDELKKLNDEYNECMHREHLRLEYIDVNQNTGFDIYYSRLFEEYLLVSTGYFKTEEWYKSLKIVLDYALETDGGGEPIEIEVEAKIPIIVSKIGSDDITKLISAVDEAVRDYFGDKFGKGGVFLSDILYLKSPTQRTSKLGVYIEVSDEEPTVERGGKCVVEYNVETKGKYTKREYQFRLDEYIEWW